MTDFDGTLRWLWMTMLLFVATISSLDPDDRIRWSWTLLTAFGTPYAAWNLREVLVDNWSILRDPKHSKEIYGLWTAADVFDQALVFLALILECCAGICAILAFPIGALTSLFLSALTLVWLSFTHTRRRREINAMIHNPARQPMEESS